MKKQKIVFLFGLSTFIIATALFLSRPQQAVASEGEFQFQ